MMIYNSVCYLIVYGSQWQSKIETSVQQSVTIGRGLVHCVAVQHSIIRNAMAILR